MMSSVLSRVDYVIYKLLTVWKTHVCFSLTTLWDYFICLEDLPRTSCNFLKRRKLKGFYLAVIQKAPYKMLCTIWYHLYNFKNVKNSHGRVLLFAGFSLQL